MNKPDKAVRKPELLGQMREAHQRVASAIEHLPDERLIERVIDGWTVKDVLAHMAWWHDHSTSVIEALREGREPYDTGDATQSVDAINDRILQEHRDDPPELTRRNFNESFTRLTAAVEPLSDQELFADDHWPWLDGEALSEMILWDTSRHYDAHRDQLERLSQIPAE